MIQAANSMSNLILLRAKSPLDPDMPSRCASETTIFGAKEACFFYTSETLGAAHKVFQLALKVANESVSDKNRIAAVASMICLVNPQFEYSLLSDLEILGVAPRKIRLPSNLSKLAGMSLEFEVEFDWPAILLCFGCIVLLLFENIDEAGYQEYMENRIRAMKSVVGLPERNSVGSPLNFTAASTIRVRLGALSQFKGLVIHYLLDQSTKGTTIGALAHYLLDILAWSEMESFMSIYDTLYLCKSPILNDYRIKHEVINLYFAFEEIREAKYPQFYMYMEGLNKQCILERTKFPILLAVAQKIERDRQSSGTRKKFVDNQGDDENELVTALYNDHIGAAANEPVLRVRYN